MIGEKLKELRKRNGMTQKQLADKLGVKLSTIGNWEAGYNLPKGARLVEIAKSLDCPIDYLFDNIISKAIKCNPNCECLIGDNECACTYPYTQTKVGEDCLFPEKRKLHIPQNTADRKATTKMLSELTEQHIDPKRDPRIYWAKEVTFDYATADPIRVDYMKFKPVNNTVGGIEKGDFYCYEIKSSVDDFNSPNGHNFIGDFNYYVMKEEIYEQVKDKIPYRIGVYIPGEDGKLKIKRKAIRKDRKRPVSEMLLMMFRSANRDRYRA